MESLFGTSGIRRRLSEYPDGFFYDIGRAFAAYAGPKAALGRDTRSSGKGLEDEFIKGANDGGCDIVRAGVVPTPTVGVAADKYGFGVVITASHNPPEYNGFKFFDPKGAFRPDMEERLERIYESKNFTEGAGETWDEDFVQMHVEKIVGRVGDAYGVRVLLDCAGGAGSAVTPFVLDGMGAKATVINDNRDGVFPHGLEPTQPNLSKTCEAVKKSGVDIAFAHDGDADRTCAISGDGSLIEWDTFLTILASKSKKVVTTVDASMRIEEYCQKVIRVPVGDVAVVKGILDEKAGFGGEPSGTYIFPDIHIYPDGVATVAKALRILADGEFYKLVREIPSYPVKRLKIPCPGPKKEKVMEAVNELASDYEVNDLDGVRIQYDRGWVLVRPSGTEDYVRITAEAEDEKTLEKLVSTARGWLKKAGI